jgi:hypothetical protein
MPELETARNRLQSLYRRIWKVWYLDIPHVTPSPLIIERGTHAPGYLHGTIYLFLDGHDLDMAAKNVEHDPVMDLPNAPSWQRDLIHEMMHELQEKVTKNAITPSGRALHEKYAKRFPGLGHDEAFFTAIASRADFFQLTTDQLVSHL